MQSKNYGDEKSKNLFAKALKKQGFSVDDADNYSANGLPLPDLYGQKDGIKYKFELKQRECDSTQYGDILISEHKLKLQSNFSKLYFVFFYTDGIGYIVNPQKQKYRLERKLTARTTRLGDYNQSYEVKAIFDQKDAQMFRFDPKLIYSEFDLELARLKRERKQKKGGN